MRSGAKRAAAFVLGVALVVGSALMAGVARADDASDVDLTPDDFAYGVKVPSPGDAAAYRASLPLAVYQTVLRGDLGDVRMFNERGELVPYRIERPSTQSTVQSAATPLPVFTLRDNSREALDAIRVTIESGGTRVDVQAPVARERRNTRTSRGAQNDGAGSSSSARPDDASEGASSAISRGPSRRSSSATARSASKGTASQSVASYLLDSRSLQSPISTLEITWPDNAPDFAGRLRIEASDDLGTWQTVVTGAPIANLHAGDARIVERRVDLAGISAKFWRLSWADQPAPFPITAVAAEPTRDHVDVPRQTLSVPGTSAKPGEFEFDLGARVPTDRVTLELPEQNSIVEAELLSRDSSAQPWRSVTRGGFYRLKSTRPIPTGDSTTVEASADLTNGSITIAPNSDRYWLARIDTRNGALGHGTPKLRVGWLPHEVVFLARGNGPFTLAYGSSKAQPTTALGAIPATVTIVQAEFTPPESLGGDARLQPTPPPRTFWTKSGILWTVLVVGVALLAFMAYRLSRELKK
jgi:hypothetical protein